MKRLPQKSSLVSQVAALLKEEIRSGSWTRWLPGEHELCAEMHVSRVTLRAALSQLHREGWVLSSRGRRREIARVPNEPPAAVSKQVAMLMPSPLDFTHPTTMFWIDNLREHLAETGYHLTAHVSRAAYSRQPIRTLPSLIERLRPAAWILVVSTAKMQEIFEQAGVPCVIAGSRHAGIKLPSVDLDYRAACRHAVGQFVSKGHRRLVFLNLEPGAAGDLVSEQGFNEGVAQCSRSDIQGNILRHDGTVAGVCRVVDALLRQQTPPTAYLVSWPSHFLTVMSYLTSRGLRIPKDVALIARDDESLLDHIVPSVARYGSNPMLYVRKLSKVVLGLLQGEVVPAIEHQIIPRFIPGQTLG